MVSTLKPRYCRSAEPIAIWCTVAMFLNTIQVEGAFKENPLDFSTIRKGFDDFTTVAKNLVQALGKLKFQDKVLKLVRENTAHKNAQNITDMTTKLMTRQSKIEIMRKKIESDSEFKYQELVEIEQDLEYLRIDVDNDFAAFEKTIELIRSSKRKDLGTLGLAASIYFKTKMNGQEFRKLKIDLKASRTHFGDACSDLLSKVNAKLSSQAKNMGFKIDSLEQIKALNLEFETQHTLYNKFRYPFLGAKEIMRCELRDAHIKQCGVDKKAGYEKTEFDNLNSDLCRRICPIKNFHAFLFRVQRIFETAKDEKVNHDPRKVQEHYECWLKESQRERQRLTNMYDKLLQLPHRKAGRCGLMPSFMKLIETYNLLHKECDKIVAKARSQVH